MAFVLAQSMPAGGRFTDNVKGWTGLNARQVGTDLLVDDNDPVLLAGPKPVLAYGDEVKLTESRYAEITKTYIEQFLNDDFESQRAGPRNKISIDGGYGVRTDLEYEQLQFFLANRKQLSGVLTKRLLPFMADKFSVSHVVPVRLEAKYQQAVLSLAKLPLLISRYGLNETGRLLEKGKGTAGPWDSILPKATDIGAYLDALIHSSPLMMAIPMHRVGSALYFVGSHLMLLPRLAVTSMMEQIYLSQSPIAADADDVRSEMFRLFRGFPARPYLKASIESVNSIMRFLNDPRSFGDAGVFNAERMLRTQSVIGLMFADLSACNDASSRYVRDRLAFSYLDKVANLVYGFDKRKSDETSTFKRALALSTGKTLAETIKTKFQRLNATLGRDMGKFVNLVYKNVHASVRGQLEPPALTEQQVLDRLWALRGTNHGAFLRGQKFEDLYHRAATAVPPGVQFLPLVFTWALAADFQLVASI